MGGSIVITKSLISIASIGGANLNERSPEPYEERMKPPLHGFAPDDFQTPPEALIPLLAYLKKDWLIWECAEGKGYLVKALREYGYRVIGSDILTGRDFLTCAPDYFDCIVTNPPYSIKHKFLTRCYQLGKPFALLLPLTTLETRTRQQLFAQYGLEIILFDKRINFHVPSGKESKSWFATAWFTNGLKIGKELTFVTLVESRQKTMELV